MQIQRISLTVILTFLITVITTCFSPLLISVSTVQIFAQTPENRKVEADRLFQQAIEQLNRNQPEAAIQSWEQARRIYQQIGDRLKEAESWFFRT